MDIVLLRRLFDEVAGIGCSTPDIALLRSVFDVDAAIILVALP
jgi:hypothetical protein